MWNSKTKTILIVVAVVLLIVSAALKQADVTVTPEQEMPDHSNKLIPQGRKSVDVFSKPYEENKEFKSRIAPFFWVEFEGEFSLCLNASERYKRKMFASRSKEGFRGNGDDWTSLAEVFLEEMAAELKEAIEFDPESGMFCAYSADADALARFAVAFKDACENDDLIEDLFSRVRID